MSSRTIFLARLIGLTMIAFSLAMLTKKAETVATVTALLHDPVSRLTFGIIALVTGLAVVLSHNRWSGGVLPVVVTVLGWTFLIRGLLLMFLPGALVASVFEKVRFDDYFGLYVGGTLLLGLYLAIAGFRAARRAGVM